MPPPNVGMLFTPPLKGGKGVTVGVKEAVRTLLGFYRRYARLMSMDLFCRVVRSGLQLAIPMVALKVFQVYLPAGDLAATGWAALAFAVLVVASSAFEWGGTLCGQWLGFRIEAAMREKLFDHIERLPFAYFDRTKTGEILSRITGDLRQVGSTAHLMPETLVEIVLMLTGSFAVMFYLNVRLALWTLLPVPFILLFAAAFQKRIHAVWRGNRQEAAAFAAHVENAVQGIREVKSFTCEDRERRAFQHVNDRFRLSFERMSSLYAPLNSGTQLMLEGYSLLYIALGAWMVAHGSATFGQVFAFYMYSRYVTMPMMRVVNFLDMFQQGIVGVRRYLEVLKEEPEECAEATGESGMSGKSGLSGRIEFQNVRSAIGMVAQRPFLFDGSIRENLLLGDAAADDAKLLAALKDANLDDFVKGLPQGLDTPVGERGVRLSGGQAQRIAIARVFLKNPPILILDEATSALDTFAEAAVQDALGRLSRGRTTIIIAHRLTTIRHATMICYLEDGRIVESGSHDELIAKDGRYRALLAIANGRQT